MTPKNTDAGPAPIALLVETSRAYGRGLLRGIAAYAQTHDFGPLYHSERSLREGAPTWIRQCQCHPRGIIARLESEALVREVRAINAPTVDLRGLRPLEGIPLVQPNQRSVARLAAEHLMERQFVNYACCCFAGLLWAEQRADHFADFVRAAGDLCQPSLSSVQQNAQKVGFEAAALLDRMMRGEPPPEGLAIEPLGVVARQSTDITAVADEEVAAALRLIRERACEGLRVTDIGQELNVSQATLKRKFSRFVGRSPKAEILRVQIDAIQRMLRMTEYSLAEIAQRTGFKHAENMCATFRRKTGQSAMEYRQNAAGATAPTRDRPAAKRSNKKKGVDPGDA